MRLQITPVPIAFGAVLNHTGTLGPAEVPGKREHMYRHMLWQAERAEHRAEISAGASVQSAHRAAAVHRGGNDMGIGRCDFPAHLARWHMRA